MPASAGVDRRRSTARSSTIRASGGDAGPLALVHGALGAPGGDGDAGRRQAGPHHVARRVRRRARRVEVLAAVEEGEQPAEVGRRRRAAATSSSSRTATAQSASAARSSPATSVAEPVLGGGLGDDGGELQHGRRRVGPLVADGADVLDGDAVDGADLLGQQLERHRLGQRHDELVDDPTAAALEDVDRRDVTVDGADAAGDLAERTRPVGQPDPHDQRAGVLGRRHRPRSSSAERYRSAGARRVSSV